MTEERLDLFAKKLNSVANEFISELSGDSSLEAILNGIVLLLKNDEKIQEHPGVKSCLHNAAEHCSEAAMLYYASWK